MRTRLVWLGAMLIACAHSPPAHVTLSGPGAHTKPPGKVARRAAPASLDLQTADARAWSALADSLCRETGGLEYGGAVAEVQNAPAISRVKSDDVSFGLARAAFFDVGDAKLRPAARPWLDRVIATFRSLPPRALLVVTSTLEDDVQNLPAPARTDLATRRSAEIDAVLRQSGLAPSRFVIRVTTEAWEGSYDGPATLDPAEGRVSFAVSR